MTENGATNLPKKIVAIDDSLTLRKFIESALATQSYVSSLIVAENAQSGLDLIHSAQPDLVICDLTMPDRRGDEVCEELLRNPATKHIPVILMSSDCEEIAAIQKRLTNVQHVIVKPFTRQLLVATVGYVIKSIEHAKASVAAAKSTAGTIVFRGTSSTYPLTGALRAVAKRKLTGIFRIAGEKLVVVAYCKDGKVTAVSTRSVEVYLQGTPYETHGRKTSLWRACEDKQRETLTPFLFNLADLGGLAELTAATLSELYGQILFARLWKEVDVSFEFEEAPLPDFINRTRSSAANMNVWILQTLKYVEDAAEMTEMVGDPYGMPVLTPVGCQKIDDVKLDRADRNILSMLDGSKRLVDICGELDITPDAAAHRLFCYRQLGYVDYWPSALLEAQPE